MKALITILLVCLILAGCASRQDYRLAVSDLHLVTNERISVGVQDHRPYITNHDKEEYFVGIQRGGFGIPVSLATESMRPLAEDMTSAIVKSFANAGATVTPMKVTPVMDKDTILHLAQSQQAEKIILLTLLNWKTDTYQSTDLIYDISMTVFDVKGHELTTKHLQGTDDLGKSILDPQSIATELAPKSFQKKLEELFGADISAVLSKNP
ncbi:MAG: hypothetical protein WC856_22675 [Methylococcaceae bacterium]